MPLHEKKVYDIATDVTGEFLYQKLGSSVNEEFADAIRQDTAGMPMQGFAWPEKRLFAITTKEAAAASSVYAQTQKDTVPDYVFKKINDALDLHGVTPAVMEKVASAPLPDSSYLVPELRLIAVTNAEEVKTAEIALRERRDNMEVIARTRAYRQLYSKAEMFGVKLASDSTNYVAQSRCHVPTLLHHIGKRINQTRGQSRDAYRHLSSGIQKLSGSKQFLENFDAQDKIAQALHEIDCVADVTHRYDRPGDLGFADPILAVYNTNKEAGEYINMAGQDIPISQILNTDPDALADLVGGDFLEDAQDENGQLDPAMVAQILEYLPADVQQNIVSELGYSPLG